MASSTSSPAESKKEQSSSKSDEQPDKDASNLKLVPERAFSTPAAVTADGKQSFIRYTKEQLCALALIPPSLKKPDVLTAPLIRDDPGNLPELKTLSKSEIKELLSRDRDFMTTSGGEISTNPRNNSRPIRRWQTADEPAKDDDDDGEFILSPSRKAFPSSQAGASPSSGAMDTNNNNNNNNNTRRHQNNRALTGAPPGFGGRRDGGGGRDGPNSRSNVNNSRTGDRPPHRGDGGGRSADLSRSRGGEGGGRPLGPPPGLGGAQPRQPPQQPSRDAAAEAELAPVDLGLSREEMAKMSPMELFERERQVRRAAREGKSAAAASAASPPAPSTPKAPSASSSSTSEILGGAAATQSTDPLDLLFQKKLFVEPQAGDEKEPAGNFNRWFDSKTTSPGPTPVVSAVLDGSKEKKEPSPLGSSLLSLIGGSGSSSSVGSASSSTGGSGSLLSLIAESKPVAPAAAPAPSAGPASWGAPSPSGAPSWGKPLAAADKKPAEEKAPVALAAVPVGPLPMQQQGRPQPQQQPPPASALHMLFQTAKYNPSLVNARPPNMENMQTADAIEGRLRQAGPPPAGGSLPPPQQQQQQQQQQPPQQPGQFTSPAILSLLNSNNPPSVAGGGAAQPPTQGKPDFSAPRPKGSQQQQHPPQHMLPAPYPYPPPYGKMPPQNMPPMMHPHPQGHFYGPPHGYPPPQMHMPPQQPMPGGGGSGDGLARWFKLPPGAAPSQTGAPRPPPAAQIMSLEEIEGRFGGAPSAAATIPSGADAKK